MKILNFTGYINSKLNEKETATESDGRNFIQKMIANYRYESKMKKYAAEWLQVSTDYEQNKFKLELEKDEVQTKITDSAARKIKLNKVKTMIEEAKVKYDTSMQKLSAIKTDKIDVLEPTHKSIREARIMVEVKIKLAELKVANAKKMSDSPETLRELLDSLKATKSSQIKYDAELKAVVDEENQKMEEEFKNDKNLQQVTTIRKQIQEYRQELARLKDQKKDTEEVVKKIGAAEDSLEQIFANIKEK